MSTQEGKLFRPLDLLIAITLIGVTLASSVHIPKVIGHWAEVREKGRLLAKYRLDTPSQFYSIETKTGLFKLAIDEKGIRVVEAPCLHKICVRTGTIKLAGRSITCAPAQLSIRITGKNETDNIDAITQ